MGRHHPSSSRRWRPIHQHTQERTQPATPAFFACEHNLPRPRDFNQSTSRGVRVSRQWDWTAARILLTNRACPTNRKRRRQKSIMHIEFTSKTRNFLPHSRAPLCAQNRRSNASSQADPEQNYQCMCCCWRVLIAPPSYTMLHNVHVLFEMALCASRQISHTPNRETSLRQMREVRRVAEYEQAIRLLSSHEKWVCLSVWQGENGTRSIVIALIIELYLIKKKKKIIESIYLRLYNN